MSANQNLSDQSILLDFRCVLPINGNARSKISDALKAIRYWSSTALCHRDLAGLRRDSSTNPFRKYQLRSKASKCKNRGSSILFFQLGIKGAPVLLDKGSTRSLLVCYISSTWIEGIQTITRTLQVGAPGRKDSGEQPPKELLQHPPAHERMRLAKIRISGISAFPLCILIFKSISKGKRFNLSK